MVFVWVNPDIDALDLIDLVSSSMNDSLSENSPSNADYFLFGFRIFSFVVESYAYKLYVFIILRVKVGLFLKIWEAILRDSELSWNLVILLFLRTFRVFAATPFVKNSKSLIFIIG